MVDLKSPRHASPAVASRAQRSAEIADRGRSATTVYAWTTVALLSFLYFVSFIDRVILALLVQPLKADLGLTDLQLGVLFGPAFAIFYALVGLPIARVADRGWRVGLIAVGALTWGVCTVASGLVNSYAALVALRIGLAIGEASLTPATYSLIGALFPSERRVLAASIYSAVGIAGASASYVLGAIVIQFSAIHPLVIAGEAVSTWRLVFFIVGLPPIVGAFVLILLVREPQSERPSSNKLDSIRNVFRSHAAMYIPLFCGAGLLQATNAAFAAWGPEHLRRDLGWAIDKAGTFYGLTGLVGAAAGVLIVPAAARLWQARGHKDSVISAALLSGAVGGFAAAAAPMASDAGTFLALSALGAFGLYGSSTGLVVAMQILAPAEARATLVAILVLCITLLGQAIGPPAVPMLSDHFVAGDGLGQAMTSVAVAASVIGLAILASARKPVRRYLDQLRALLTRA